MRVRQGLQCVTVLWQDWLVARLVSDPRMWQNIESFCPVGALSMPFGWSILGADW